MDARAHPASNSLLTTAEMAAREDFYLGEARVSPSTRVVSGPGDEAELEPRVMQVLVALADAAGSVVTRETLFDRCWGSALVGDDSLNRAIAGVRRVSESVAVGSFVVETVPRTGYRLIVKSGAKPGLSAVGEGAGTSLWATRRATIAGVGAVATTAAAGFGLWSIRSREERQFNELMARGEEALDYGDPSAKSGQYFQRAVAMRPDNANAQGLFAYSRAIRAVYGEPGAVGVALQEAERAARYALAVDPNEPNARLALTINQQSMLDFSATEERLREILATAPANVNVMRNLWALLVSVGRISDALALVERSLTVKPLAAGNHYPRAQLLWILGRTAEADRIIDKAMQYWPSHQYVRYARFTIFAYTGRPRAALAMIEKPETAPQNLSPAMISLWRMTLAAFDQRKPAIVAAARRANIDDAKQDLTLSTQAILALSVFGDIDSAFDVANDLVVFRRSSDPGSRADSNRPPPKSTAWRFAPWMFTPPTSPMRADPRFKAICDAIGLTEYWVKRGIKPDYQLGIA